MGCLFFFNKSEDTKGAKLQILLNKMGLFSVSFRFYEYKCKVSCDVYWLNI